MLNPDEKDYVVEVLSNHVAPLQSPRETVAAPFIGTPLPQLLRQGLPREIVIDAVRLCLENGWTHQPPWLVLLLNLMPVNRSDLRSHLRRLATPAGNTKPILVVVGDKQSGKSYSIHYIDHFSYNQPPITTYRLELKEDTALETGPAEMARDLVAMMGRSVAGIPPAQTNQKLYVRNLAKWVLNEAVQVATQHWIMLDNFTGPSLRPDTRDFIAALSDLVTTGVFAQRCRVILIGFDRAMLTVDPGKVDEEAISRTPRAEIEVCIDEIARRESPSLTREQLVSHVFEGLPKDGNRMREVNIRLRELCLAIGAVKEIAKRVPGLNIGETLLEILKDLPAGDVFLTELKSRLKELRESADEG